MTKDIITFTAAPTFKTGDIITIAGDYAVIRNPDRRWWQWWKPRFVASDQLQQWEVV